jgi:hypothetical protein
MSSDNSEIFPLSVNETFSLKVRVRAKAHIYKKKQNEVGLEYLMGWSAIDCFSYAQLFYIQLLYLFVKRSRFLL